MKTPKPIGTIDQELADCRAAWADNPNSLISWCCHHEILLEPLFESADNRIRYILSDKVESEQAVRLRNFRPLRFVPEHLAKARADWCKARAELDKAVAVWAKAKADIYKAVAKWNKASADWDKASAFDAEWPHNTWTDSSIF